MPKCLANALPSSLHAQDELKDFLNALMIKIGAITSPGLPITSCRITPVSLVAWPPPLAVQQFPHG